MAFLLASAPLFEIRSRLGSRDTVYYRGSVSLYDDLDILDEKITANTTQQIALLCYKGRGVSDKNWKINIRL